MGDIFVLRDAALCGDRAGSGFCSDAIDPGILVRVCVHIGYYCSKGSAKWDECRCHICVRFLRDCISDPPATLKPVLHYAFSWQLSPTQMKCTQMILPILHFIRIKYFGGYIKMLCTVFPKICLACWY